MKIILSRKGYDSQYGRYPSIILKNGEMISFPIPVDESNKGTKSSDLKIGRCSLAEIFNQLGHKNTERIHHVDPDITSHFMKQSDYGAFGQGGAAFGHLKNKGVDKDDLFLFYGTFNFVKQTDSYTFQYDYTHPPFHAIWGYLKIDRKLDLLNKNDEESINTEKELSFLKEHPHFKNKDLKNYKRGNIIYIGKQYGHLYFNENLRLTKIGYKKSYWKLPSFFKGVDISYHKKENFINNKDGVEFLSCPIGQEFVFQANEKIENWIKMIIKNKV